MSVKIALQNHRLDCFQQLDNTLSMMPSCPFTEKADEKTFKCYREAEVIHGRVAMLAAIEFLVGEAAEGSSFLFDAQISGPAITHFSQASDPWSSLSLVLPKLKVLKFGGWILLMPLMISQDFCVIVTTMVILDVSSSLEA